MRLEDRVEPGFRSLGNNRRVLSKERDASFESASVFIVKDRLDRAGLSQAFWQQEVRTF